jgi:hypothetical protein
MTRTEKLRRAGFDLSKYTGAKTWRVRCSQCEALCINGVACHERGCPNAKRRAS